MLGFEENVMVEELEEGYLLLAMERKAAIMPNP